MRLSFSTTKNLQRAFRFAMMIIGILFFAAPLLADVCVWRDPEKTMGQIFPEAKDYKSLTKKISTELRKEIEKALGAALDPSEKSEWASYEISDKNGKVLGRIIACAQDGEYGAIEVVLGVTPDGKVKGVYIQRSREKVSKELRSKEFLQQFIGKTAKDELRIGVDLKGFKGGEKAAQAVAFAVKKMLILYEKLK